MDRSDYISGIEEHLNSKVTCQNGETILVYREVDPAMLAAHYGNIKKLAEAACEINIISESDRKSFLSNDPSVARAYGLPKTHIKLEIPPLRFVLSG